MQYKNLAVRLLLPLAGAVSLAAAIPSWAAPTLKEFVQPNLEDISASIKVIGSNDGELKKLGRSYVEATKLQQQVIQCKEPSRVRYEGKKGLVSVRYVTNGNRKLTQVPTLRINK